MTLGGWDNTGKRREGRDLYTATDLETPQYRVLLFVRSYCRALTASIGRHCTDRAVSLLGCIFILVKFPSYLLSRLKSHFYAFPSYNISCLFDVYKIRHRPRHCNTHHQVRNILYYGSIHALRVTCQYMLHISWLAQRILYESLVHYHDRTIQLPGLWHVQCCRIDWWMVLVPETGATRYYSSTCTRYWFQYKNVYPTRYLELTVMSSDNASLDAQSCGK